MLLSFNVEKQIITRTDTERVVTNSMNYLYAQFSFSDEWTGEKTAVFKGKHGTYNALLDAENKCLVPWEILTEAMFDVSVFCGDLITANAVKIFTIQSGYEIGDESRIPTPEIYTQVINKLNEIEAEVDPEAIERTVDEYLADKEIVTEDDVEQIVADYIEEHKEELRGPKGDTGETGPQGPKGDDGADGVGVPTGGTTGQVLIKKSNSDYDTEWEDGVLNEKFPYDISSIDLWKIGTIDKWGNLVNNNARLRTSQYLDVNDKLIIHINDNSYEYGICLYSDVGTQIETGKFYYDATLKENVEWAVYYQSDVSGAELLELFPTLKYIKVLLRNVDSTATISPSEYDKISLNYQRDTRSLISYLYRISGIILESTGAIKIKNAINSLAEIWQRWNGRLAFGMNTSSAPVPLEINGQLYANGTIIAHNTGSQSNNRWNAHIYEGYSNDNYSRMTMLIDKHNSEVGNKRSLEFYYYTGADHSAASYAHTKIGSDVAYHSFYFDRDELICQGLVDFRFPVTLGRIAPSTLDRTYDTVADLDAHIDPEGEPFEHLPALRYIFLKNAANGTMFYDTERNKVVCKINGAWCDLAYTDASSNYPYL